MHVMTGIGASLLRPGRVYIAVAVVAPILVLIGVEGFRAAGAIMASDAVHRSEYAGADPDRFLLLIYVATAVVYIGLAVRDHRHLTALYALLSGLYVLGGTASLYGLLVAAEGLIPSLQRFDPMYAAFVVMSVLLVSYVLFHRRAQR